MAWGDLVQSKWGHVYYSSSDTQITVTFDSAPTEGNLLIAAHYSGNGVVTQPTGWSVAYWLTQPVDDDEGGQFYKIAGSSEPSAVTVTCASANEHVLIIAEFEGPWAGTPLVTEDHDSYATGDTARSLGPTSALNQADNMVVGVATGRDEGVEPVSGGGGFSTGFTEVRIHETQNKWADMDYKIINSSAAQSATWDAVNYYAGGHHAGIAVYEKGSVGGGPSIPVIMAHLRQQRFS